MEMPNKHYITLDMSCFPSSVVNSENKEVYLPIDKPAGRIHAELKRKQIASKLWYCFQLLAAYKTDHCVNIHHIKLLIIFCNIVFNLNKKIILWSN